MAIGTEEVLPGGVAPQFVVDVSAGGTVYRSGAADSSINKFAAALRAAAKAKSSATAIVVLTAAAACLGVAIEPWLLVPIGIAGIVLLVRAANRHARERRVAVLYRLDEAAGRAFQALRNGVGWLASSRALWRVTHQEPAQRPANTTSVSRIQAQVRTGTPASIVTNIGVPAVAAGETLLFLPDVLLLRGYGESMVSVPYSKIRVAFETTHFSESQSVPDDSVRIGSSWLYANKDGGPDRRRANNSQIPVLEYAQITLSWTDSGCVLLASNVAAARHFANALQLMTQWRAQPVAVPMPAAAVAKQPARKPPPVAASVSPEVTMPVPPAAPTELERALQASLDRKRRLDELVRQAAAVVSVQSKPVTPAPPALSMGQWLPQGRSATVHGFATGDFCYVGERLLTLSGSGIEPSLINPSMPIDPSYTNTAGAGMDYWPSYSTIVSSSRRAFLQWLDGGRKDPNAYIGYVFLFFYGLERRVYELMQGRGSSADEVLAIANEVARLLGLYAGSSGSFASYGAALLDLIASIEPRARELAITVVRHDPGPSQPLKVALGELALAGRPVPAALALEWIRSLYSLNTPATRCAAEFELLFHVRYAKQFGEGMVVKPNKTSIDLSYRPASSGLESVTRRQGQIPDVTMLARPLARLTALAQECSSALDPFSRFLGKNADGRESLAAFALLPDELVEATSSADAASLASLVRSRLDAAGRAHLASGELLPYVRLAKPEKVSKNEAMLLAQALEKLGYGIEPDVRLGGPVYEIDGRVVVFRRLPDCPSVASDEYGVAALLVRLGAMVSAADDAVSQAERELLERHVEERLRLTPGERQRLAAHLAWLLEADLGMTGLKRRLESLPKDSRSTIGKLLVDVAATDGHVDAREMKILEKLYDLLGLPSGDLYRDVHAAQSHDDEPVAVEQPAAAARGFAIPPPSLAATTASGIDMDRVRLKIAETRQVSTLLSSIFVEEEPPPAIAPAVAQANTIGTLDAAHSELLRRLTQRESWPREEIERLAGELSLLPDGALETINDYAYATAAEPLWEDDDPISINPNVARELIV